MRFQIVLTLLVGLCMAPTYAAPVSDINGVTDLAARNNDAPADYKMLYELGRLASLSYCIKHELTTGVLGDEATKCPLKMCDDPTYKHIEILNTFNFNEMGGVGSGLFAIDHINKRLIASFRGTSSATDWFGDLDAVPVKYKALSDLGKLSVPAVLNAACPKCHVHRGFYNFVRRNSVSVIENVINHINNYPDYKLIVVGHSLGGALATLTGLEFQLLGYNPLVVTYGCPKLGNNYFVDFMNGIFDSRGVADKIFSEQRFDSGLIRVVHVGDPVVSLPPGRFFKHAGFQYFISKKDLPHLPKDLVRVGITTKRSIEELDSEDEDDDMNHVIPFFPAEAYTDDDPENKTTITKNSISLGKNWQYYFGKGEHAQYFYRISGCKEFIMQSRRFFNYIFA
ncbi:triacylglycerol lipase precursor [Scheffersomyces coipomensis]|uniref:triacylglycerol lipase precursor n=1 Tax=Scheffersomyces coipomensis TaxID=1788519 RepID=UPI00315D2DB3